MLLAVRTQLSVLAVALVIWLRLDLVLVALRLALCNRQLQVEVGVLASATWCRDMPHPCCDLVQGLQPPLRLLADSTFREEEPTSDSQPLKVFVCELAATKQQHTM